MQLDRRQKTYVVVRSAAALVFVLAATVLPRGPLAGIVIMVAGVVAVLTCLGSLAGGPGERAGAQAQNRAIDRLRAPQGDWPPYEPAPAAEPLPSTEPSGVVEQARRPEAAREPRA